MSRVSGYVCPCLATIQPCQARFLQVWYHYRPRVELFNMIDSGGFRRESTDLEGSACSKLGRQSQSPNLEHSRPVN